MKPADKKVILALALTLGALGAHGCASDESLRDAARTDVATDAIVTDDAAADDDVAEDAATDTGATGDALDNDAGDGSEDASSSEDVPDAAAFDAAPDAADVAERDVSAVDAHDATAIDIPRTDAGAMDARADIASPLDVARPDVTAPLDARADVPNVVDAGSMDVGRADARVDAATPVDAGPPDDGLRDAARDALVTPDGGTSGVRARGYARASRGVAFGVAVDRADRVTVVGSVMGDADFGSGTSYSINTEDAFVVSYAPDGGFRWLRRLGDRGGVSRLTRAFDVALDADDNVYAVGVTLGSLTFGTTFIQSGLFVVSYAPDGALRWARNVTSTTPPAGLPLIAVDGDSVVCLFSSTGTNTVGTDTWTGERVLVARLRRADGGFLNSFAVAPVATGTNAPQALAARGGEVWASVYDPTQVSVVTLSATGTERVRVRWPSETSISALIPRDDGSVAMAGAHRDGTDVPPGATSSRELNAFIRVSPRAGGRTWSWTLPSAQPWAVVPEPSLATGPGGNLYLAGPFRGRLVTGGGTHTASTYPDIYVAAYAPGGTALWSVAFTTAGSTSEYPHDVAVDSAGRVYVVGYYFGDPDLGDGRMPFASNGGVLVLRYTR